MNKFVKNNKGYIDCRAALNSLKSRLSDRTFNPDEYHVVLCPDCYTQSVELALFADRGALDCEVLTLSRLSRRLAPSVKTLGREGCVMLVARAVEKVKDDLTYYRSAAGFSDFARNVYKTLQLVALSDVDMSALAAGENGPKFGDLALIAREYAALKADYLDTADRLATLIEAADCDFVRHTHFYALGYDDTDRLTRKVFDEIAKHALSFDLYSVNPREDKRSDITLYCAHDKIGEYKRIAAEICDYIFESENNGYSDIAVICPEPTALIRILGEYGIPLYADVTKRLSSTAPVVALSYIHKISQSLFSRRAVDVSAVIGLSKNPYSRIDTVDAELLQSETFRRGLHFVEREFAFKDERAARAFAAVLQIVKIFDGGHTFADGVRAVIDKLDFASTAQALGGTDEVSPVIELTELLDSYGAAGDEKVNARSFFCAAQSINVNSLPRERNCVTVTSARNLRFERVKRLFIADFNEGVLPAAVYDNGLITDAEMEQAGGAVEPSASTLNMRERDDLRAVVLSAENVFCTYSLAVGKSSVFLTELAHTVTELDDGENSDALFGSDNAEYISKFAPTVSSAREAACRRLNKNYTSIAAAVGLQEVDLAPSTVCGIAKDRISVSELSSWFTCPYKRFLSYSVGVSERRNGFGAPDFGTIIHKFMELFTLTDLDTSESKVRGLVDEAIKIKKVEVDEKTLPTVYKNALNFARVNAAILQAGAYTVTYREQEYSNKSLGTDGRLVFRAKVDRVDYCGTRARVIDYKTGDKKFEIANVLNGTEMQLPLYAWTLESDVTGYFYIRPGKKYGNEKEKRKMVGRVVRDMDTVKQYVSELNDPNDWAAVLPIKLNSDGTDFDGRLAGDFVSKDKFDSIIKRAVNNANVATDEILGGHIERSPIKDGCKFCPYKSICFGGEERLGSQDSEEDE